MLIPLFILGEEYVASIISKDGKVLVDEIDVYILNMLLMTYSLGTEYKKNYKEDGGKQ